MKKKTKKKAGKFLLDMAKLVFGGVILAGLLNLEIKSGLLFTVGGTIIALSVLWGFILIKLSQNEEE